MLGFNPEEIALIRRLDTPVKIQNFLNKIPRNLEIGGETYLSPRRVLREWRAHCLEGALLAAAIFWYHGERPLVLDLRSSRRDFDHVVALFQHDGLWGAISKTNHTMLRWRDPVYKSIRELAMSYFHEYTLENGRKTLRNFSKKPIDLSRLGDKWVTDEKDLRYMIRILNRAPHENLISPAMARRLRCTDPIEIEGGKLVEWVNVNGEIKLNPILTAYTKHYYHKKNRA